MNLLKSTTLRPDEWKRVTKHVCERFSAAGHPSRVIAGFGVSGEKYPAALLALFENFFQKTGWEAVLDWYSSTKCDD